MCFQAVGRGGRDRKVLTLEQWRGPQGANGNAGEGLRWTLGRPWEMARWGWELRQALLWWTLMPFFGVGLLGRHLGMDLTARVFLLSDS